MGEVCSVGHNARAPVPPDRSLGEEGGRLSCGGHFRPAELLTRRRPQSEAPDEPWRSRNPCRREGPVPPDVAQRRGRPRTRHAAPQARRADLVGCLSHRPLPVRPAVSNDGITGSPLAVARDRRSYDDLWRLADDLLTNDETAAQWRAGHVRTVERRIGTRSGTDGSTGTPYLRGRTRLHYFPLLWELRAWR